MPTTFNFTVLWSEVDRQWMGLCTQFPTLVVFRDSEKGALVQILRAVADEIAKAVQKV